MRSLILVAYRATHRLYSRLKAANGVREFALIKLSGFSSIELTKRVNLVASRSVQLAAPRFFNHPSRIPPQPVSPLNIQAPPVDLFEIRNGSVIGGTDIALSEQAAITPDIFIESRDTCPAEIFGRVLVDHQKGTASLYLTDKPTEIDSGAVSLLGQSTNNYAHWLTEILPKLVALDATNDYDDLALLVDDNLPETIYESIGSVSTKPRKMILVKRWQQVRAKQLIVISSPGYEPYVPHGLLNTSGSQIINNFSQSALDALRTKAVQQLQPLIVREAPVERVFLTRSELSNNLRGLTNTCEIEEVARSKGFTVVDPSKLHFSEQVAACSSAKFIVGPIGAALANMIFAPKGSKILALSPYYDGANYYFYSNLAGAMEHDFSYLLGQQTDRRGHPMHRNYNIDLSELARALDALLDN